MNIIILIVSVVLLCSHARAQDRSSIVKVDPRTKRESILILENLTEKKYKTILKTSKAFKPLTKKRKAAKK